MNKYAIAGIFILVLSMCVTTNVVAVEDTPITIGLDNNITKLNIIPSYANIRLQPGESKETTVTVINNDNKSITVSPDIKPMPYSTYIIDTNWITVSPSNINISAGASTTFTVNVSVPKDATNGGSGIQIAFTNETIPNTYSPQPLPDPQPVPPQPVPYPEISPTYVHVFQLSIDVWRPPNLQLSYPYINDQIEAGKAYDYEIKVKNVGSNTIGISPKLVNDIFYGPYGIAAPILADDSIIITAPSNISAGATEIINIHVNTPVNAVGFYNGYIDLKSDDPYAQEGETRISLNLNIWKQPTEPFVKNFTLDKSAPIKIEISSYYNKYPYLKTPREEPTFNTNIIGPDRGISLNITKTVLKGSVNMGSDIPSWASDNASSYYDTGGQQLITYETVGSPGEWMLNILPNNTQGFDYSIIIGEDK